MGTRVKTFIVKRSPFPAKGNPGVDQNLETMEERINSWANENSVRILNASIASYNWDKGESYCLVALVAYEG